MTRAEMFQMTPQERKEAAERETRRVRNVRTFYQAVYGNGTRTLKTPPRKEGE